MNPGEPARIMMKARFIWLSPVALFASCLLCKRRVVWKSKSEEVG